MGGHKEQGLELGSYTHLISGLQRLVCKLLSSVSEAQLVEMARSGGAGLPGNRRQVAAGVGVSSISIDDVRISYDFIRSIWVPKWIVYDGKPY